MAVIHKRIAAFILQNIGNKIDLSVFYGLCRFSVSKNQINPKKPEKALINR